MIYPIVMVIFAVSDLLAYTAIAGNGNHSFFGYLIAFMLQFLPLFLIPYAFKLAGGVLGRIHDVASGFNKRGVEAIKGNPNDPTSFRNRYRKRATDTIAQGRLGVESSTRGNRSRFVRGVGRLMGGSATMQERGAMLNQQDSQRVANIWGNGDDSHAKASTLFHSMAALRADPTGARFRAAGTLDADGNRRAENEYQAADGSWFSESVVRTGYGTFGHNHAMMQENYKQLLGKTEPLSTQNQDQVFADYVNYANGEHLDEGTANGRWQGIAIPLKGTRLDLRRRSIQGNSGQLTWNGAHNDNALLTEFAGLQMHEIVKQTPGGFAAVRDSIMETMAGAPNTDPASAARAYDNLHRFVQGAQIPPGAVPPPAPPPPPGGPPAGPGGAAGYSTSDSAAAKNARAAEQVLNDLNGIPGLQAWINANRPNDT